MDTATTETQEQIAARHAAIAATNIQKRFGHVEAIRDASIHVNSGEVVALFGDNGAGKSTFLKTLQGIHKPDNGSVYVAGKPVEMHSVRDAQALGVETVYQDLALAPELSVTDNVFLGHELMKSGLAGVMGALDRKAMTEKADSALRDLSIALPSLSVPVRDLSGGQRQAVAIARAVMWARSAVLLDEPTAALGARQSELVCQLMRRVAKSGLGVLVVSHDLPRILGMADRVVILWRGRTVLNEPASSLTVPDVVATMVGYGQESN